MKLNPLFPCLLGLALCAQFVQAAEEDNVDPLQFRNYEIGDSRVSQSFELNYGGGISNTIFYPSIAWNKVFWGGAGAVHIPFVYWLDGTLPTSSEGSTFANPSHTLIGSGLQLRYYHSNNYQGWFYGGGIRFNYWDINYDRVKKHNLDTLVPIHDRSFNVIPLVENGYLYPIEQVRNLYAQGSLELGANLVQESYEKQIDWGDLPFAKTSFYWTVQAGISYAF